MAVLRQRSPHGGCEEGITTFTALALADDDRILDLLRGLGELSVLRRERGAERGSAQSWHMKRQANSESEEG